MNASLLILLAFFLFCVFIIILVLKISNQVSERLNQMQQGIAEQNKIIGQGLGSTASVFGNVKEQLGRLESTNNQILEIGKNISSLQELLRAPKFRGQMGETLLENLLSQVLPKEHYHAQFSFKTGDTVDAVINLGSRIVPIDAKFSLENFQRMIDAPDEASKAALRKKFVQDVKTRAEEISSKYILPEENTYDFALMYIPAENVYYEIAVKEDILSFCMSKKVIPVSPNTFYAYLQVICMGLKGMKVEENAKNILKGLSALSQDMDRFSQEFNVLGGHIQNSRTKYEDSLKRLERLNEKLSNVQGLKDS